MLEAFTIFLLVLWLLGMVTGSVGMFIHLLLVVALIMFVFRLFMVERHFD
jgi:hypothetical protein